MKTIIDEIQERHDKKCGILKSDAHKDRGILLDLLREVKRIAEHVPQDKAILAILNRGDV